jgi:hypothetical protein
MRTAADIELMLLNTRIMKEVSRSLLKRCG